MNGRPIQVLSARWILPVSGPPINGGWVRIAGDEVVEIGRGGPPAVGARAEVTDLGDVAVLPGLVNAHTHLEFSDCDQPIGEPGVALYDWIGEVITARRERQPNDPPRTVQRGLAESHRAGVRLIGEIATPPTIDSTRVQTPAYGYPSRRGPQVIAFAEVLGLNPDRGDERMAAAIEFNGRLADGGWSPHAPYSTSRDLLQRCVQQSAATGRPLAMHVAESPAERELLIDGSGPFAEALKSIGAWREGLFPWGAQPMESLIDQLSGARSALLIHANDLRANEIERLANHSHLGVVYCPRTHAFFRQPPHPVDKMLRAGVRVALGTDSRASNPDLSLWREAQYLWNHRPDLDPQDVLAMATLHGADSLSRPECGRIAVGCRPGFGTVPTSATSTAQLFEDFAQNEYRPLHSRLH